MLVLLVLASILAGAALGLAVRARPAGWIEFFIDEAGEWRFRVQSNNGEILVHSEGYVGPGGAEHAAQLIATRRFEVRPLIRSWPEAA